MKSVRGMTIGRQSGNFLPKKQEGNNRSGSNIPPKISEPPIDVSVKQDLAEYPSDTILSPEKVRQVTDSSHTQSPRLLKGDIDLPFGLDIIRKTRTKDGEKIKEDLSPFGVDLGDGFFYDINCNLTLNPYRYFEGSIIDGDYKNIKIKEQTKSFFFKIKEERDVKKSNGVVSYEEEVCGIKGKMSIQKSPDGKTYEMNNQSLAGNESLSFIKEGNYQHVRVGDTTEVTFKNEGDITTISGHDPFDGKMHKNIEIVKKGDEITIYRKLRGKKHPEICIERNGKEIVISRVTIWGKKDPAYKIMKDNNSFRIFAQNVFDKWNQLYEGIKNKDAITINGPDSKLEFITTR